MALPQRPQLEGRQTADEGERIGMLLDLNQGSMTVWKNGERLGVMQAEWLSGPLCWAVEMYAPATSARIESAPSSRRHRAGIAPASPTGEDLSAAQAWQRRSRLELPPTATDAECEAAEAAEAANEGPANESFDDYRIVSTPAPPSPTPAPVQIEPVPSWAYDTGALIVLQAMATVAYVRWASLAQEERIQRLKKEVLRAGPPVVGTHAPALTVAHPRVAAFSLLVPDYDSAIDFFVGVGGFELTEDRDEGRKRWVTVRPPGAETQIVLARADTEGQRAAMGRQLGGRVGFFLHTDDFNRDHARMKAGGVKFREEPRQEEYGVVRFSIDVFD